MTHHCVTSVTHSSAPRVPLFCSYHILTSSVIYYLTDARQLGIYLLNIRRYIYIRETAKTTVWLGAVLKTESEFSLWFFFALTRTCNKRNPELEKMRKSSGKDLHHVMIEVVLTMLHFSIAWGSLFNENVRYDWDDWVRLGKKLERKWICSRLNLFVFVISAHHTKSSKIYSPSFNIKLFFFFF